MKLTILIDVDEVIADFVSAYISIAEKQLGRKCPIVFPNEWQISKSLALSDDELALVHSALDKPGLASSLDIIGNAKEAINKLNKFHDVWFVTAPFVSNKTWEYDRRQWFIKHFSEELSERLIFAKHKQLIQGNVLIDDKIENLEVWKEYNPNGFPILWEQSYTKNISTPHLTRTNDWSVIKNLIDDFAIIK